MFSLENYVFPIVICSTIVTPEILLLPVSYCDYCNITAKDLTRAWNMKPSDIPGLRVKGVLDRRGIIRFVLSASLLMN